jgi:hypothetical protein
MLVVNTLLNDGQSLEKLGIRGAAAPRQLPAELFPVTGINVGGYHPAWKPEDPACSQSFLRLLGPLRPARGGAAEARAARGRLLAMSFDGFRAREVCAGS